MFLKISQNSHQNTCAWVSFLIKLQAWGMQTCFVQNTSGGCFWMDFDLSRETYLGPCQIFFMEVTLENIEAATRGVLYRKLFLKISQNSQETPVPESLFKSSCRHRCFPVNFAKFQEQFFYRTPLDNCFWKILNG